MFTNGLRGFSCQRFRSEYQTRGKHAWNNARRTSRSNVSPSARRVTRANFPRKIAKEKRVETTKFTKKSCKCHSKGKSNYAKGKPKTFRTLRLIIIIIIIRIFKQDNLRVFCCFTISFGALPKKLRVFKTPGHAKDLLWCYESRTTNLAGSFAHVQYVWPRCSRGDTSLKLCFWTFLIQDGPKIIFKMILILQGHIAIENLQQSVTTKGSISPHNWLSWCKLSLF